MSSMKKNVLAAALVAGMGMAGWAAAESTPGNLSTIPFQYGTSQSQAQGSNPDLSDAEDVAIQQIFNNNSVYTMAEDIQFIVAPAERIVGRTTGFHVKITLDDASAKFNCTPTPTPHSVGPAILGNATDLIYNATVIDKTPIDFMAVARVLLGATGRAASQHRCGRAGRRQRQKTPTVHHQPSVAPRHPVRWRIGAESSANAGWWSPSRSGCAAARQPRRG